MSVANPFDFLTVLLSSSEEEGLQPRHLGVYRQNIGDNGDVGVGWGGGYL